MGDAVAAARAADALPAFAGRLEAVLGDLLPAPEGPEGRVHEAMAYAARGGKRLRAFVVDAAAAMFGVPEPRRLRTGAAVELVHAYSLVHDDLPAMDDDDTRRNQPSCHKAFDEATAILAGDALLTLAFEVLAAPATHPDAAARGALVAALARAAGGRGMVAGQMIDLASEHVPVGADAAIRLARLKTGSLMAFSAAAGALLGNAGDAAREALEGFGSDLGLAFQIADDGLDAEGDEAVVGKKLGKDAAAGKATLAAVLGAGAARREARRAADAALARLDMFGCRADFLRSVVEFALARDR